MAEHRPQTLRTAIINVLLLAGLSLIVYGVWRISEPVACIVAGGLLSSLAIGLTRLKAKP